VYLGLLTKRGSGESLFRPVLVHVSEPKD